MFKKNMQLNKIIINNARQEEDYIVDLYGRESFMNMKKKVKREPLTIFEFYILADVYNIDYKVSLEYITEDKTSILIIKRDEFAIQDIDDFINERCGIKMINNHHKTLKELQDFLYGFNVKINIEAI